MAPVNWAEKNYKYSHIAEIVRELCAGPCDRKAFDMLPVPVGGDNENNLGFIGRLVLESGDIRDRGDSLLGDDTSPEGNVNKINALYTALVKVSEGRPLKKTELVVFSAAQDTIKSVASYHTKKIDESTASLDATKDKLSVRISYESEMAKSPETMKKLFKRRISYKNYDGTLDMDSAREERERNRMVEKAVEGGAHPGLFGRTDKIMELNQTISFLTADIARNSTVIKGINKLLNDISELQAVSEAQITAEQGKNK